MKRYTRYLFTVALLLLLSASLALGEPLYITPSGNGAFIIQGNNLDGVAGIQLDIAYTDFPFTPGWPKVTQGGLVAGAILAANTSLPGLIKIAIISTKPFSGSGQIATIAFAKGSGILNIVSQKMITSDLSPIGTQAANDSTLSSQQTTTATSTTTAVAATTSTTSTSLGTVSMSSDVQPKGGDIVKPPDTNSLPVPVAEPAAIKSSEPPAEKSPASEIQKSEISTMTSYKGTLENFREYKGEKSPAILIALFNKQIAQTIRQKPAIALSDGKTPVKIIAEIMGVGDKSPNFALKGAKLISLNKDDASSTWVIEAMPQAGIMKASLTILTDNDLIEYPLTLAPPVEGVSPDEADFVVFLKDSGAAIPKRDLNGDGKHDYLDDFIYTANHLIRKSATTKAKH